MENKLHWILNNNISNMADIFKQPKVTKTNLIIASKQSKQKKMASIHQFGKFVIQN